MNAIFRLSNFLVLPFWTIVIALPGWRWTERIIKSPLISAAPALIYGTLVFPHLAVILPAVTRPAPDRVAQLLGSPTGATIAWAHFLAFDLLVGRWIYLDSRERRLGAWVISPILFLTLLLGPVGFLLYLAIRLWTRQNVQAQEPSTVGARLNSSDLVARDRKGKFPIIRRWLDRGSLVERPLLILGSVMVLTFLITLAGLAFDPRAISGAPAWLKPAKFSISVSVYCFTLVWLLGFLESRRRLVQMVTKTIAVSLAVEMIVIIAQAARGTTSHFNMSTPLNSFLWITMDVFIMVVWVATLLLTVILIRQPASDKAFAWSLQLGLMVSLLGMATGFFMVRSTPEQRVTAHGVRPKIVGAHSIGVPDGGPGLPVLGWSTAGGDMRVAHFFGLHGLQVLPFFGWWITRNKRRRSLLHDNRRLALIWIFAMTYAGAVVLLAWQALRGESVIHPDRTIVSLAGALISAAAIAVLALIRGARVEPRTKIRTGIELAAN